MLKLGPTKSLRIYISVAFLSYLLVAPVFLQANTSIDNSTIKAVQNFI
jgi:hypothetical protein